MTLEAGLLGQTKAGKKLALHAREDGIQCSMAAGLTAGLALQNVIIDTLLKDTTCCPRDLHGFAAYNKERDKEKRSNSPGICAKATK